VIVAQVRADGADARSVDKRVDISVSGERLQQFLRDGLRIEHTVTLMPEAERLRSSSAMPGPGPSAPLASAGSSSRPSCPDRRLSHHSRVAAG
jgi:hypothetical protein